MGECESRRGSEVGKAKDEKCVSVCLLVCVSVCYLSILKRTLSR